MIKHVKTLLSSLENHQVKYVIIGGVAVILHGVPRMTGDVDLFVEATLENCHLLLKAIVAAGYELYGYTPPEDLVRFSHFTIEGMVKVDVMLHIPGLDFATAWANREMRVYQGQRFYIVSKSDLIIAKRKAGRPQDLQDAEALEALRL